MNSSLIDELYVQRLTLAVNVAVSLVCILLIRIFTRKYDWNKGKLSLFSFLYGLNTRQEVVLAISVSRFIFVIVSVVLSVSVNVGHLAVLLLQSIVIFILNKDVKGFIYGLLSDFLLFAALFFEGQLFNYYLNSSRELYVMILYLGIGMFVTLFDVLDLVEGYYRILTGKPFEIRKKAQPAQK